jgi:hypothetical protein
VLHGIYPVIQWQESIEEQGTTQVITGLIALGLFVVAGVSALGPVRRFAFEW